MKYPPFPQGDDTFGAGRPFLGVSHIEPRRLQAYWIQ